MGKFNFPLPGRKKQTAATVDTQQPPQSKAQKFFGTTTPFNLDVQQGWAEDVASTSGISVTVTDAPSPTYSPHSAKNYAHSASGKGVPQGWDDESDILPRNFRGHDAYDGQSEVAMTLRQQPSSSTIRSWYDRSKQPLSVSQQTSSSAIARGMPSKAARMLDVENTLAPVDKRKKKPAKLDLSLNTRSSRQNQWDGMVLGPDFMTKSPSVMSTASTKTPDSHRRLQKRSTKESLRSQAPTPIPESARPATSGSGRKYVNHPNGVPDLYGHYEQMSLRQLMDLETEELEAEAASPTYSQQISPTYQQQATTQAYEAEEVKAAIPTPSITRTSPTRATQMLYGHRHSSSHSTKDSRPSGRSQSPPASVSSRHTRTSKASKRTDYSFQDPDIMGKSILSLSSDSEDDDGYEEPLSPTSPPVPNRTPSYYEGYAAHLNQWQLGTSGGSTNDSPKESRPRSVKRASFAPYHTYLPVPGAKGSSSSSSPSILQAPSPGRDSAFSESSDTSNQTWRTKSPAELSEARAVTMLQAQGPGEHDSSGDSTSEQDQTSPSREPSTHRDSIPGPTEQPTPPLSPSSVNFYIRSAHSSIDGSAGVGGDNRFIAVSRQEELLLAALRQKKKLMRQSFIAEEVSARLEGRPSRKSSTATQKSRSSTSTTGDSMFNFDFPTPPPPPPARDLPELPPGAKKAGGQSAPQIPPFSPIEPGMSLDTLINSPASRSKSKKAKKGILKIHVDQSNQSARRDTMQSDDWPISPHTANDTEDLKLFFQDMDDSDRQSVKSSHSQDQTILRPRAFSGFKPTGRRKSSHAMSFIGHRPRPSVVPEAEEEPQSPTLGFEMGFKTLRPMASITADDFPTVPSGHNKKAARLSAVGNHDWCENEQ